MLTIEPFGQTNFIRLRASIVSFSSLITRIASFEKGGGGRVIQPGGNHFVDTELETYPHAQRILIAAILKELPASSLHGNVRQLPERLSKKPGVYG